MSGRYSSGEVKVRPGVYFRETKGGGAELVGARNGVVAAAFRANWGPIGEVITLESPAEIPEYYGDDAGTNSNVAMLEKIFLGGASQIRAIRVGEGGTKASITLKDTTTSPVNVVKLEALFPGSRPLSITIKDSLAVETQRECIIYSGTKELMKVTFAKGAGEPAALVEAINSNTSAFLEATKLADGNGVMATLTQADFTTPGVSRRSPAATTPKRSPSWRRRSSIRCVWTPTIQPSMRLCAHSSIVRTTAGSWQWP